MMADERKVQDELQDEVKDAEIRSEELSEEELDKVTGGATPDGASTSLMKSCATGTHIPEVTITH